MKAWAALCLLLMACGVAIEYQENIKGPTMRPTLAPRTYYPRRRTNTTSATVTASITVDVEPIQAVEAEPSFNETDELNYSLFPSRSDFECTLDPELEKLVHTNGTRTRVYIFYHSNRTEMIVNRFAFCKDWIVPYRLVQSPYMESQVYSDLFQPNVQRWVDEVDYVITCTYRHALEHGPLFIHPLTNAHLKDLIQSAHSNAYDVIPLETIPRERILVSLVGSHGPHAMRAWNMLLIKMGFNMEQLASCTQIMGFWRTSYLIRPVVLKQLTALMLKARYIVDNDRNCNKAFVRNAMYKPGDPIVAYAVFGTAYYQMHPFVFERLPAFFLTALNASVPDLVLKHYVRPDFAKNVTLLEF